MAKPNLQALMQQAQQMQKKMQAAQDELETIEVSGSSGGGMVMATVTGKKEVKSVKLSPDIMDEEVDMIEDLIVAALNQAMQKADETAQEKMGTLTGGMGMNIPGM